MYPRSLQPFIEEVLAEFRVLYLTGARQSGKTTLAEFAGQAFERGILFYTGQKILPFRYGTLTFYALPIGLFTSDIQ